MALAATVMLCSAAVRAQRADPLYAGFHDPPNEARPFVRWWWNGNGIAVGEIERQLDVLAAAGIGGVELAPIAMPQPAATNAFATPGAAWLGPGWNHLVRVAVDGVNARGMTADLVIGTGRQAGGPFLPRDARSAQVYVGSREVRGPGVFASTVDELLQHVECRDAGGTAPDKLLFLRLFPATMERYMPGTDLMGKVDPKGNVTFELPPGPSVLYVGTTGRGCRQVADGLPGGDGPIVDPYGSTAVAGFLKTVSDALDPVFGELMGNGVRAASLVLSGPDDANWTPELPQEFVQRRGYEVVPYLPFVLSAVDPTDASDFADTIRRARYDFYRTLADLLLEHGLRPFDTWCHAHGVSSRCQPPAFPSLMGLIDAYMLLDLPMGETRLFGACEPALVGIDPSFGGIHGAARTACAASAAHLTGRPIVSCLAMLNPDGAFRATPAQIKQADDFAFLVGVNHTVLHGYNYSPASAGVPGWTQSGTCFSEGAPWWPHLRRWADYNARLSWVLRQGKPCAEIAILGPTSVDRVDSANRSTNVAGRAVSVVPPYLFELPLTFQAHGYNADLISEAVLRKCRAAEGRLLFGSQAYRLLLIDEVAAIEPETAEVIGLFADSGGRVCFVGGVPSRAPGMRGAAMRDAAVRRTMQQLTNSHARTAIVVPPPSAEHTFTWAGEILERLDGHPPVRFETPLPALMQLRRKIDNRMVVFFANLRRDAAAHSYASFELEAPATAWRWDPESGSRRRYAPVTALESNRYNLALGPQESLLLVFEPAPAPTNSVMVADSPASTAARVVPGPWRLALAPVEGRPFTMALRTLTDLASLPESAAFAGTVRYETTIDVGDHPPAGVRIGRAEGVAEVSVNGTPLGVQWYGERVFAAGDAFRPGTNTLSVSVMTPLVNYCLSLTNHPAVQALTAEQDPAPVGLFGPVELLR